MTRRTPAFSVIIPVCNMEAYLAECLDSVLSQDFQDYEIVIVNDGSTDASLSIISRYMDQDDRLVLIDQANAGTGPARNAGIKAAKAEGLLFLDADDCLAPGALDALHQERRKAPCDILIFNGRSFRDADNGRLWDEKPYFDLGPDDENVTDTGLSWIERTGGQIQQPGMKLYNRQFIVEGRIAFSDACAGEDYYFFYVSMIHARRVRYFHYQGYCRRYRPGSSVTDLSIRSTRQRIASFCCVAATPSLADLPKHRRLIASQHAYYAAVLWVRSMVRTDPEERNVLLADFRAFGLASYLCQNRWDWKLAAFYRIISLPRFCLPLQRLSAFLLRRLYQSKTRLL